MTETTQGNAKEGESKRWSLVWIVPVATLLIGGGTLFYHYSQQGPAVTLLAENAEGIQAGKTAIKSRSVEIGQVEKVTLTGDMRQVQITARLHSGMKKLLYADTVFWVVKPQVGRGGVSGLGTVLSGAYIEVQPGTKGVLPGYYTLLATPPLAAANAKGLRIMLGGDKAGQLSPGDPVLFRGYRVGTVETSRLDTDRQEMIYQLFIAWPYDRLVTANVRFWKESGIAVEMSAAGLRVQMGSLTTLFSGGVSFDIPSGRTAGNAAENKAHYRLFKDRRTIQDSLFSRHLDYLLFFSSSVRGLQAGAPVEFRGIRLGTVAKVPFFLPGVTDDLHTHFRVPVLVRIEAERFINGFGGEFDIQQRLQDGIKRGLRATLKTGNLISGSLYVDLNFYDNALVLPEPVQVAGYHIIPTMSSGLSEIQQKLMSALDKINGLPLTPLLTEATGTLKESRRTLQELQTTLHNINQLTDTPAIKALPKEMQQTLRELSRSLKGVQPGSPAHTRMLGDLQRLDQVLRELHSVLKNLNNKSNSLIFEAEAIHDRQPEKAN
ncbi:intermembrane transport protein PqiB [Pantoea sp. FN060301]|uniref:intermembrane transport protein PqiB n=1 Tax=Pantoea sp. FN060301 TaxID=3420380 RepID=UPI003D18652B